MKCLHRATIRLVPTALVLFALLVSATAHAVGRLADIRIVDRDTGTTLPVYRHRGDYWVAGQPGARYAILVRNATSGRALGVVSVDGVNVISGETASWEQTGYVLDPGQSYEIAGWRKNDAEIAAFHFTASQASYASRTGRPDHVGVIGVAVFRERRPPPSPVVPYSLPRPMPESGDLATARERSFEPAGAEAKADRAPAPRLGTGHGERESSWVEHTEFERRSARPDEVIRIRYDSRENLIAIGVIPAQHPRPPRPNPFPGTPQPGYVPDPPPSR